MGARRVVRNRPEKSKWLIMKGLELYKGEFLPTLNLEKINMLRERYKTLFLRELQNGTNLCAI